MLPLEEKFESNITNPKFIEACKTELLLRYLKTILFSSSSEVRYLLKIKSFRLLVNEEKIVAKRFVQQFIGNSLVGMVESLRLKDPSIRKIDLVIEFNDS